MLNVLDTVSGASTGSMTEANVTALGTAFTKAGGDIVNTLVSFTPYLLAIAVLGFTVAMVYKAIKKVKGGGK